MSPTIHKKKSWGATFARRDLAALVLAALLMAAGGVILGLNWNRWFGTETETFHPELDPNAADWNGSEPEDRSDGENAGIKIPGYPSITLPADTENASVTLLNPEGNPCYFTFELVLNDMEEVLYKSGLVPPGQAITDITLSRSLPAGEYEATIRITTTSLEEGSAMNGADMVTTLIVQ